MYNDFEAMVMAGRNRIPGDHPASAIPIQQFDNQCFQESFSQDFFNHPLGNESFSSYDQDFYNDIQNISVPPPTEAGSHVNFSWEAAMLSAERDDAEILSAWNSVSETPVSQINYSEENAGTPPVVLNNSQVRIIPPQYDKATGKQLTEAIVVEPDGKTYTAVTKQVLREGGNNFSSKLIPVVEQSKEKQLNFAYSNDILNTVESLKEENDILKQENIELKAKLYELTKNLKEETHIEEYFSKKDPSYKNVGELLRRNKK